MIKSKVKYIQSLSQKKQRDTDGVFVAEGPKIINELLSTPGVEALELFALKEWIMDCPWAGHAAISEIDAHTLERISFLTTPHLVLGLFRKMPATLPHLRGRLTLMTENIQDPGNMGSIIRCADWFGIRQVICSKTCADVYSPKGVQSTMGSIARVEVLYEDLEDVLDTHADMNVYAATLDGENIHGMEFPMEGVILIGNESKGISEALLKRARRRITIPRIGQAESLNAAVAAGIILSHAVKRKA